MCGDNNVEIPIVARNKIIARGTREVFPGLRINPDKNIATVIVQTVYKSVIFGNSYNSWVSREKTKGNTKIRNE